MRDDDTRGEELFQSLVRGDAVIGLIADPSAHIQEMTDAFWASKSGDAFKRLGDCYLACMGSVGAFEGVDPADADGRPWSEAASSISDERHAIQAALRAYFEGATLGHRGALAGFVNLSRRSSDTNRRRALTLLQTLPQPSPADVYQRALVHNLAR